MSTDRSKAKPGSKTISRLIAERVIENLEEMSLPKTAHLERLSMISEVEAIVQTMLLECIQSVRS